MYFLTLLITKVIISIFRLLGRGATTFPGRVALYLSPKILPKLTSKYKIIMVTGTNGKTTTTKIIGKMLSLQNIDYISNISGANLVPGITTTFIEGHTLFGKPKKNVALIEIDEAAFLKISKMIPSIDYLVVTNFFRDQLDRYGELYTTLKGVHDGLSNMECKNLILNADDSLSSSLFRDFKNNIIYYGFSPDAYTPREEILNTDANFCIFCKNEYKYTNHVYGHLGGFYCEKCGYKKAPTVITCSSVDDLSVNSSKITFKILEDTYSANINLPGLYNIYNALSAISLGYLLQLDVKNMLSALEYVESSFGRMETITINDKKIKLILVKNPTGFNQVIDYLLTENDNLQVGFLLNDNSADGTDISWIWDVDFEKLTQKNPNTYVFGKRAYEMATRLKYAGINRSNILVTNTYEHLIDIGLENTKSGESFYILPTYTALLEIRAILKEKFNLKEFWK